MPVPHCWVFMAPAVFNLDIVTDLPPGAYFIHRAVLGIVPCGVCLG
jgi:hypothetical protein